MMTARTPRTPTRAPSAWTPLVGQPELMKMHSNSMSLRVQHQSQHALGSSEMLNAIVEAAMVSMLDSMVPLVDAPEHGIMPLDDPSR